MEKMQSAAIKSVLGKPKATKAAKTAKPIKATKPAAAKVNEIHVKRAKGGFIASHIHEDPMMTSTEHILPDLKSLKAHMMEHLGDNEVGEPKDNEVAEGE